MQKGFFLKFIKHKCPSDGIAAHKRHCYLGGMKYLLAVCFFNFMWYIVKNSWGAYSNQQGGYLFMAAAYFNIKTSAIFLHKDGIPPAIRKKTGL